MVIEAVDSATDPMRKTIELLQQIEKNTQKAMPKKKDLEDTEKGWVKIAAAIASAGTAIYGLTKLSPVFGSYLQMFLQGLGALADTILLPLAPAFEWIINKEWEFVNVTRTVIDTLKALFQWIKDHLPSWLGGNEGNKTGLWPGDMPKGELGKGVGGLVGDVVGGITAIFAKRAISSALIKAGLNLEKVPGWVSKPVGLAFIATGIAAGGLAGSKIGENYDEQLKALFGGGENAKAAVQKSSPAFQPPQIPGLNYSALQQQQGQEPEQTDYGKGLWNTIATPVAEIGASTAALRYLKAPILKGLGYLGADTSKGLLLKGIGQSGLKIPNIYSKLVSAALLTIVPLITESIVAKGQEEQPELPQVPEKPGIFDLVSGKNPIQDLNTTMQKANLTGNLWTDIRSSFKGAEQSKPASNVLNFTFYVSGNNESIIQQVETVLREKLRGIGLGVGIP